MSPLIFRCWRGGRYSWRRTFEFAFMSQRQHTKPTGTPPTLSVVVPVYNGTKDLQQCLTALASSQYDDFDVLVVDDGSTEPVEPLVTVHGFHYMRINGPGGPARARNIGAAHVSGQYLVFI